YKDENEIFTTSMNQKISYPDDGNESCYQIEENSYWFQHRNNFLITIIKKFSKSKNFYDIGGGNGFVTKALQEAGFNATLIEPGYQGCINAKKRDVRTVVCSLIEDIGFSSESLDSVGLFDVVEHIEKDVDFLSLVADLMKKDSYIFITVPAYKFLWSADDADGGHYKRYTSKKMKIVLEKAGFNTVYSTYLFSLLIFPVFLLRTIPSRLGLIKNISDANKQKREFVVKKGILSSLLNFIFRFENKLLIKNRRIPFGSSLLFVAKK
ncbi:MAG: class I SAM-dependent methyltransferase, partial [Flavobacteriales bacterium]|nr:class I SAM-dependent methyltransferase [Flavobacteriales bacterium]